MLTTHKNECPGGAGQVAIKNKLSAVDFIAYCAMNVNAIGEFAAATLLSLLVIGARNV